jgi:serine protein kinase
MDWLSEIDKEETIFNEVFSFDEYMDLVDKEPSNAIRTCSFYMKDMFNYYEQNDEGGFKLFQKEYTDSSALHGQFKTQKEIYRNLNNFIEEGQINKFLLLVGPNGSSKSSLVNKIMKGSETYSETDDGALYSFSWIFPIDQYTKGSLGLSGPSTKSLKSFAKLEDTEISAILGSELKDHPILLLPLKTRQKVIEKVLKDDPSLLEGIKKTYLYNGDLSKRNKMIFKALLKNYHGDYREVYKHIRVERIYINKRYSTGAATIEPQVHVDARMQQITMDKRLGSLPPSLQSLNLFSMSGEIVLANRGVLEFSDLLKRPLDAFKYLLMTMESKTINLGGIQTELDIFFIGSSNEIHFTAFKQHPDFNSFKGRFNFIKVPYLLNFRHEMGIYQEQINNIRERITFEPCALEALSMWAVMTRLRASSSANFKDKTLGKLTNALNPLEKSLYYASEFEGESLESDEKQLFNASLDLVRDEYNNDPLYEGKFGISPREVKQLIYELSDQFEDSISFVEIIEVLKTLSSKKMQYDFLNINANGDYHNYPKYLHLLEKHYLNILDRQVRDCLGLIDNRSYKDYLDKYITHILAMIKGEKIKNQVTGKFEEADQYFIKEFESNIKINETAEKFRSSLISRIGAYSLDYPGNEIPYLDLFKDLVRSLKESFRADQKAILDKVSKNLIVYLKEKDEENRNTLNDENQQVIESIFTSMREKYNYSEKGAHKLLNFLIRKMYT